MRKVEIRVRPVVRHIVTRYTASEPLPAIEGKEQRTDATLETLGEFANEYQAEAVAEALRAQAPKPMQYVCVERGFDALTNAIYFDVEDDALEYALHAQKQGREFRVFSRVVTDPIAAARIEAGMVGYGFPGGVENVELPSPLTEPKNEN